MTNSTDLTRLNLLESQAVKAEFKITSLEEIRDEHQRQLLELGGFIGALQTTMFTMVDTIGKQQEMISTLIDEYQRSVGDLPLALLQQQVDDELAARRET